MAETAQTPTIEDQLRMVVGENMRAFHDEYKVIIQTTIEKTVNGKIDKFRLEQNKVNEAQNKELKAIRTDIRGVVNLYNGSNSFFRGTGKAAKWVLSIGGAIALIWGFIKYVVIAIVTGKYKL